jgi:PIN domain nuclease of toxin-antitoxin system
MSKYILDSSALLAVFKREPGADQVEPILGHSVISAVNLSECVAKVILASAPAAPAGHALEILKDMVPEVVVFDQELVASAASMILLTKSLGLSFGDRACLATAVHLNLEVVTADKIWAKLKLPVKIKVIR